MGNQSIKKNNMLELAEFQHQLRLQPKLKFIFFELTDSCNLHCKHCGSNCSSKGSNFLPVSMVKKTLESIARSLDPRHIMVCLTGGEPFLHPDIISIIRLSRNYGFSVGITSNGTLIDDKLAREVAQAGLNTISISIDGIKNSHDNFRCGKGCFEAAMNGVRFLREYYLEPEAITVIHSENYNELESMYSFFSEEGFFSWRITNIEPIGRAINNSHLQLSIEQIMGLLSFIREKRFDPSNNMHISYGCSHFVTLEYENEVRDYYFQCGAGTFVASIMANGDIGACLDIERQSDLIQGNIFEDDFMDVWINKFQVFRADRTEKSLKCNKCDMNEMCLGDSAHTWDFVNNEPRLCLYNEFNRRK